MKISNDKYYTPINIANQCIDMVYKIIGEENISEVIEPSVGNGSFLHHPKMLVHFGYDIAPECSSDFTTIIKGDFLNQPINYLPGRLVIGNPPYGERMYLAQQFYKKSVAVGDYIAFILPISQLNNTSSLYEFDLIYSVDLGVQSYSGRELKCCFNIYRRPESGILNKKPVSKLKNIAIYRQDSKGYNDKPYDIRMCYWGNGSAGKILNSGEKYSAEYKIKVNINNEQLKKKIVDFIKNYDWRGYVNCIAMKKIQQFHIVKVLKDNFEWLD